MTESSDLTRVLQAAAFAADKHRNQRRKDVGSSPYINHPLQLANVLCSEGQVFEADVLIAALLHDTIEDTDTNADELERAFGRRVASIVMEVTDDKSLPKEERKRLQVTKAPGKSDDAKLVKIADKICNLRDIASDPPAEWTNERREAYFHWAKEVVKALGDVSPALQGVFDETYRQGLRAVRNVP